MNESSQPTNTSRVAKYSVSDLYNKAWATVKKNIKPLAIVTILGVVVSVIMTTILTVVLVDTIKDAVNDSDGIAAAIFAGILALGVTIIAGVYTTLLQVVALKKATEGKTIDVREVFDESLKYVPRALAYGAFIMLVLIVCGLVMGLIGATVQALGVLLGIGLIVAFIIALFRYAFIQFLIVEPKEMAFMERFNVSKNLTDGIYGTLFVLWLIGFLIAIGGGIVGGILSAPFNGGSSDSRTANTIDFGSINDEDDLRSALDDATDEANDTTVNANTIIASTITGVVSGFVSLVVMGALLELYKQRKTELKV